MTLFKFLFVLPAFVLFQSAAFSQTIEILSSDQTTTTTVTRYRTPGSNLLKVGAGVNNVSVSMWGGGGGGAAGGAQVLSVVTAQGSHIHSGGGGGASYWAGAVVQVAAGSSHSFLVGTGGLGGLPNGTVGNNGANGSASNFLDSVKSPGGNGAKTSTTSDVSNTGGAKGALPTPANSYITSPSSVGMDGGADLSLKGGNGGHTNNGARGSSGNNFYGSWGYNQQNYGVSIIGGSDPGTFNNDATNPGYGGGGGGFNSVDFISLFASAMFSNALSEISLGVSEIVIGEDFWNGILYGAFNQVTEVTRGGNGGNGMVDFYTTYPTYKLSGISKIANCTTSSSTTRSIKLYSTTMPNGTYDLKYTIVNRAGNVQSLYAYNIVFSGGEATFVTPTLDQNDFYTLTIVQIGSGNTCLNNVTENNTVIIEKQHQGNDWIYQAGFPGEKRQGAVVFVLNNKAYVGTGNNGTIYYDNFWELDLNTFTWTRKADFPGGKRTDAVAFTIGNKAYVGTGKNGASIFKDLYEYDPITNAWTQKSDMPSTRYAAVAFTINNFGYVGTGNNGTAFLKDFYQYNPQTDLWTSRASFTGAARAQAVGFSYTNKGIIGSGSSATSYKDFYYYNQDNNTWTRMAGSDLPAIVTKATGFSIGSKGYIGSGNGVGERKDFYELDLSAIAANSPAWVAKLDMPGTLSDGIGFSNGTKGFVGLGLQNATLANNLFEYEPSSKTITMNNVPSSICKGVSFNVSYTIGCSNFDNGNVFNLQLSDASGSFSNGTPVTIGTVSGTGSGTIAAVIPNSIISGSANIAQGSNYRVRIQSTNPVYYSSDRGDNIIINPSPVSELQVNASGVVSCSGGQITLSAITELGNASTDTTVVLLEDFNSGMGNWTQTNSSAAKSVTYPPGVSGVPSYGGQAFPWSSSGLTISSPFTDSVKFSVRPSGYSFLNLSYSNNNANIHTRFINSIASQDNSNFLLSKSNYPYYVDNTAYQAQNNFWDKSIYGNIILQSPSFSLVGYDAAKLTFKEKLESKAKRDIEASIDGINWVLLSSVTSSMPQDTIWKSRSFDISPFVQSPHVLIRFKMVYNDYTLPFVAIDNFKVTGYKKNQTYQWSSVPAGFTSTLQNPVVNPTVNTLYIGSTSNSYGCANLGKNDSVFVSVKQPSQKIIDTLICPSALPFIWNGFTLTGAASRTVHFTNAAGCDSTVTINLNLKREPTNTPKASVETVCNTALPFSLYATYPLVQMTNFYAWTSTPSGITFNSNLNPTGITISQTTTFHLLATDMVTGCSKVKNVVVTVNPSAVPYNLGTYTFNICPSGLPFTAYGITLNAAGTQSRTWSSLTGGCDTTATVILTVRNASSSVINKTICNSELPYSWNGMTFISAGTQTAHLTNAVGCDSAITLNLTVRAGVNFAGNVNVQKLDVSCFGGNNGTASVFMTQNINTVYNYKWTKPSVSNVSFSSLSLVSNLAAGNYLCTITDANACSAAKDVVITQPAQLKIATSVLNRNYFSCETVGVSVSGGKVPYQYTWSPTGGNASVSTPLAVGEYSVTVTDAGFCTTTISGIKVVQNPAKQSLTYVRICSAALPYTWNNKVLVNFGIDTAHVPTATGCDSLAVIHLISSDPVFTTVTQPAAICAGNSVDLHADVQLTDSTVIWTDNFNGSVSNWQLINNSVGGYNDYEARWKIVPYYTSIGPFSAFSNDQSKFFSSSSAAQNGYSTITVPGQLTHTILQRSNAFSTVGLAHAAIQFEHFLQAGNEKDSIGMEVSIDNGTSWQVAYHENPTGNIGDFRLFKNEIVSLDSYLNKANVKIRFVYYSINGKYWSIDNVRLISYGPIIYSWTSVPSGFSSTSQNPGLIVPAQSTVYKVTAINNIGCSSSKEINVTVNPLYAATITDSICTGGKYIFQGDTLTVAGTYTKNFVSLSGCDSTITLLLTVRSSASMNPLVFTTQNVSCAGGSNGQASVTVSGGTAPYTYQWTPGSAFVNNAYAPSPITQGQYLVTVKDASQCSIAGTYLIFQPNPMVVTLQATQNTCTSSTVAATVNGGTAPYTYSWSPGNSTSATATGLLPGYHTCTVTDAKQCVSSSTILVTAKTVTPSVTFKTLCTTSLPYSWNGLTFTQTGTQTAYLIAANGCDSAATLVLDVFNLANYIEVAAIQQITCNGAHNGIAVASCIGGGAPYTYSWSNGISNQIISNLNPGQYTCTITDVNSCLAVSPPVIITQPAVLTAQVIAGSAQNCGVTYIRATGGTKPYSYNWGQGVVTDSIAPAGIPNNASLFPYVTDANGCFFQIAQTSITYPAALSSNNNLTICSGSLPYVWNGLIFNAAGTKSASFLSYWGCDSTATLNLSITDTIRKLVDRTVCENNLPYTWDGFVFTGAGTKLLYLRNIAGCDSNVTLRLFVNPSQPGSVVASASATSICRGDSLNLYSSAFQDPPATMLSENFNAATNNWTQINLSTGANPASTAWSLKPSGYVSPNGRTFISFDNSQFYFCSAVLNAANSSNITNAVLKVPTFSTVGYSAVNLSFLYDFYNFNNGNLTVLMSSDSLNWTSVFTRSYNDPNSFFTPTVIPLSSGLLGKAKVYVRFQINGTFYQGAGTAPEAFIDNVILSGTPIATTYSWTSDYGGFASSLRNPVRLAPQQSAVYSVSAFTSTGCIIVDTVGVMVKATSASTTAATICSGATYTFNGVNYTVAGTYTAHFTNSVGCDSSANLVLAFTPGAASSTPTLNLNTPLTNITHTTTGATGIGAATGLPTGVTAAWANNTITISGTPSTTGIFNYTIPLIGGCANANATGTITVIGASAASSTPTLCINTPLTNITHTTTGATGIGSIAPTYLGFPAIASSTLDEDLGNVTISLLNGSSVLNNATSINSLSGTIGNASGTVGRNSDFTAFGPYTMYPGSTYSFSLSSITTDAWHNNSMAIYIDYNRNGVFTDPGEKVHAASAVSSGPHTETGNFTIPASASAGLTRMRVICNQGLITSPTQFCPYGEYEEYSLNIDNGNISPLPAGVTASFASNTITISGTPTAAGTFNYSIPLTGSFGNATGTITVNANKTVGAASSTPTLCINTALTNITHTSTAATGIGIATGLPTGVTAAWANNTITISGTPSTLGTFTYTIPVTGCGNANATGTIAVNGASVASSTPTLCINTALTNITHTSKGATGIGTAAGLPTGVTASWAANTITISGAPTAPGTFNYTIPLTGSCGNATGSITVNPVNMIAGGASSTPTLCINTPLTNIGHITAGASGILFPAPTYALPPAVGSPTIDEDLGNVTISLNGSTILNNSTPVNSLVGTIGTASGTAGSYADFTAFGPYNLNQGSTYSFSLSAITGGAGSYNNSMAIYIDYNGNGVYTDAGEKVYAAISVLAGAHTETGTFTIPVSATSGLTRMRVICNEGLITSPTQTIYYGEYEEYSLKIGNGYELLPGVTAAWASNTITISGTPTASGIFNYSIPLTGGCGSINATGTITVLANTAGAASSTPTLCINTSLTNITHATTGATGIGTATYLPAGVTAAWANNTITISGTPTELGTFAYTIPLIGGCVSANATGTIRVDSLPIATITTSGTATFCSGGSVILAAVTTPLDDVAGAKLAVGLRKLNSGYTGSALRLRRSTDNQEMDFGFVGIDLDVNAISTWLNGASGFCTVLYDQSGNLGHVTQTVLASQPLLVLAGINNKPVLRFTTAQTMFNNVNYPAPYSVIYGSKVIGTSVRVLSSKINNWLFGYWSGAMDKAYFDGWVSPSSAVPTTVPNQYNVYAVVGTGALSTVYKNGAQLFSNAGGLSGPNGIRLNGWGNLTISEKSNCEFTDVLIYASALAAADIVKLNTSIVEYYSNSYLWSTGATTPAITVASSGSYTVQVTNPNGCQSTASAAMLVTVNPTSNANITTVNKIQTLPVTGITYFSNSCTDSLIAKLTPNGANQIFGYTTAKVWIETTQPAQFVKRHYEITPATGAATASSNVTLYLTQAEFDDFNAVNAVKLPTGAADAAGIANLVIEKRSGISSDSTGLPTTYTGGIITINPADADIIWNAIQSRWEVSFDVVGFSGFFVKTQGGVLPLTLVNFTGSKTGNGNLIQWQTANEINTKSFELERKLAVGSSQWVTIASQLAVGNGANGYSYVDADKLDGTILYRLKMFDVDGRFTYSNIIKLTNQLKNQTTVYPNPVTNKATLQIGDRKLLNTQANVIDANGKIIKTILIKNSFEIIDMSGLPGGLYMLKLANGSSLKIIKE